MDTARAAAAHERDVPGRGGLTALRGRSVPGEGRRVLFVRVIFVVGLLAWGSLALWWARYIHVSTQQTRAATMRAYQAEERLLAIALHAGGDPAQLLEGTPFALATAPQPDEALEFPWTPLIDGRDERIIVLRPEVRERIRRETLSKHVMVVGEGTVLVGLLFLCLLGLYRVVLGEWRLNRQTETFVHSVTHQLRSPLAGLRALLQSFESLELPAADRRTYVRMGLGEVDRLDHLVGNILLSSRLEARSFRPRLVAVDVSAALTRLRERKSLLFREKGGALELDCPPGLVAQFDPEALDNIVENLLDNALKYAGSAPQVRLSARAGPGRVTVAVDDNGPGLGPAERERVFARFYRARHAEETARGTGLGLYIARTLARACGGDLRAEGRDEAGGARFVLDMKG